jgi:hypothetical protein
MALDVIQIFVIAIYGLLKVYEQWLLIPIPPLEYLIRLFLFYWFLQFLLGMVPWLEKIVYQLCFPFRWLHVFFHVRAAKQVTEEVEKLRKESDESYDKLLDTSNLRATLVSGLDTADENPGLVLGINRLHHARLIAFAPFRFALVTAAVFVLVTFVYMYAPIDPLKKVFELPVLVSHFYFYIGIFGVLFPSRNDMFYYYHAALINLSVRPIWLYWSLGVYVLVILEILWRTEDFFISLLIATIAFHLYILGLFSVAIFAVGRKASPSEIFFFPFERMRDWKNMQEEGADLPFMALEDLDL